MKTKCLRLIMTGQGIVILTALFGITATAQQDVLFPPPEQDLCYTEAKFTVSQALPARTISQDNKANVDLFHTQTSKAQKKCAYQVMRQSSPTSTSGFRGESFEKSEAVGSGAVPVQGAAEWWRPGAGVGEEIIQSGCLVDQFSNAKQFRL